MQPGNQKSGLFRMGGYVIYLLGETYSDLPGHLWCHLSFGGVKPKETKMMKQMSFDLNDNEMLLMVWDRLPESNQKEIKRLYAKLIAQTAKMEICAEAKEKGEGDVE